MKKAILLFGILASIMSCGPEMKKPNFPYKVQSVSEDKILKRYTIKMQTDSVIPPDKVKALSEWMRYNYQDQDQHIIFYYLPNRTAAWCRVDFSPGYKYDKLGDFGNNY